MLARRHIIASGLAAATLVHHIQPARACGCLSPPAVTEGEFAVNQSAEQIVFEVEPGWVTAHVLIRYQGDPAQFAWLIPVPEVPELGVSPVTAFGLLDQATAPNAQVQIQDMCPISQWRCHYEYQDDDGGGCTLGPASAGNHGFALEDAGVSSSDAAGSEPPPVTVINTQTVGDYQTVTFRASEAAAAVQWLHDNGFIVNPTTSIYMESYIQANMVFVAAKLVAGAGASAIKPLRMRYRAAYPTIPLILTAVAAQPHLTVTAFVYANQAFRPLGHPVVTLDSHGLAQDAQGRINYPMLLARTIDEAGGGAFAIEYGGYSSPVQLGTGNCCSSSYDQCHLANDGQCQCPGSEVDAADCASLSDLTEGIALLQQLGQKYSTLTRITTRVSAEQMTFDPAFEPDPTPKQNGPLQLNNVEPSLAGCGGAVVDKATYAGIIARQACAAMYCGQGAECVTTATGAACACGSEQVAQRFIDLDGKPSVTCVPATPPVDLRAGGDVLPDACANVGCGNGRCIDRNGVAVCACDPGSAATLGTSAPQCVPIASGTATPGAQNYSSQLATIDVCAPPPPSCGDAKLENVGSYRPGVDCGNMTPPSDMQYGDDGGACQESRDSPPASFFGGALIVLALILRRRRGARVA